MFEVEREELARELMAYPIKYKKRDLSAVYQNRVLLDRVVSCLAKPFLGKADYVAAPEPSGSVFGSLLARELGIGFLPIHKADGNRIEENDRLAAPYIDHNNLVKTLEVRKSTFPEHSRILLVDDWVDTAVTLQTCAVIVEEAMGTVVGMASIGAGCSENATHMLESGLLQCILKKPLE